MLHGHRAAQKTLRIQQCQLDALRLRRQQLDEAIAALELLERQSVYTLLKVPNRTLRVVAANVAEPSQAA